MIKEILLVAAGGAVGALVSWRILDRKYQNRLDVEIEAAKEHYKSKYEVFLGESVNLPDEFAVVENEEGVVQDIITTSKNDDDVMEWAKKLGTETFTDYTKSTDSSNDAKGVSKMKGIRMVSSEEYDSCTYDDAESFTKYSDGVITDELDVPVDDLETLFGEDIVEEIANSDEDALYIIDEDNERVYEILKDSRPFDYDYNIQNEKWM